MSYFCIIEIFNYCLSLESIKENEFKMINKKILRKKSKKSQSNIIAIVLIILLCLSAIIVVWQIIIPMIQGYKDEAVLRQDLMDVKMSINDVSGDTSSPADNKLDLIISSESNSNSNSNELYSVKSDIAYSLKFVVYNKTSSYEYNLPEDIDSLLSVQTKTYTIETGGLTNINKIDMILVAHMANGKDVTELISSWIPGM